MKLKIVGIIAVMALVTLSVSGCVNKYYTGYIVVKISSSVDNSIEIFAVGVRDVHITKTQIPPGVVSTRLIVSVEADDELEKSKQCNDIIVGALGNTGTSDQKTIKVCREQTIEVFLSLS